VYVSYIMHLDIFNLGLGTFWLQATVYKGFRGNGLGTPSWDLFTFES